MKSQRSPQLKVAKVKLQRTRTMVDKFQPTQREHAHLIDTLQSHLSRLDLALRELDHLRLLMSLPYERQQIPGQDSQQTH